MLLCSVDGQFDRLVIQALEEEYARAPQTSLSPQTDGKPMRKPFLRKGQGLQRFKKGGSASSSSSKKIRPKSTSSDSPVPQSHHQDQPTAAHRVDPADHSGSTAPQDHWRQRNREQHDATDTMSDSSFRVSRTQYDSKKLQEKRELEEFRLIELQATAMRTPDVSPNQTKAHHAVHRDVDISSYGSPTRAWGQPRRDFSQPARVGRVVQGNASVAGASYSTRSAVRVEYHTNSGARSSSASPTDHYTNLHGDIDSREDGSSAVASRFDDAETWDEPDVADDHVHHCATPHNANAYDDGDEWSDGSHENGANDHHPPPITTHNDHHHHPLPQVLHLPQVSHDAPRDDRSPPPQSKIVAKLFRQRQLTGARLPQSKSRVTQPSPGSVKSPASPARDELDESVERRIGTVRPPCHTHTHTHTHTSRGMLGLRGRQAYSCQGL
jgi:hypothetical protein